LVTMFLFEVCAGTSDVISEFYITHSIGSNT
jgi:hypothetical protein